jgi:hypothetical protein
MQPLKVKCLFIIGIWFFGGNLKAQEDTPKTAFGGYLKYMQNLDVTNGADSLLNNHLLHNRLNFLWFPRDKWAVRLDLRNRLFYGDYVELLPYFNNLLDVNNDIFNLSAWIIDENSLKMLSEVDRAFIRYTGNKLQVTAGRQRIKWGINEIWNPNDIFNAYSFFDFDYEGKPASDALNISYYYNFNAKIEIASKFADNIDEYTGALLWKITQHGYDVQIIAGLMENNIVMGTGWAGDIKSVVGFKGEITYFGALDPFDSDALIGSVSADYKFDEGTSILSSYFYNSDGVKELNLQNFALVSEKQPLNAKYLLPFQSALFLKVSEPLNPQLNLSMSMMWFPSSRSTFFRPGLSYSTADNIKLDLLSHIFTAQTDKIFDPAAFQIYFRVKWNFNNPEALNTLR